MKQIYREIKISYRWWRKDGLDVRLDDVEALEDHAEYRIQCQINDGFTSGELRGYCGNKGHKGVEHVGWWELKVCDDEGE